MDRRPPGFSRSSRAPSESSSTFIRASRRSRLCSETCYVLCYVLWTSKAVMDRRPQHLVECNVEWSVFQIRFRRKIPGLRQSRNCLVEMELIFPQVNEDCFSFDASLYLEAKQDARYATGYFPFCVILASNSLEIAAQNVQKMENIYEALYIVSTISFKEFKFCHK